MVLAELVEQQDLLEEPEQHHFPEHQHFLEEQQEEEEELTHILQHIRQLVELLAECKELQVLITLQHTLHG